MGGSKDSILDKKCLPRILLIDIVRMKLILVPLCGPSDRLAHAVNLVCMPVVSLCPCGSETLAIFLYMGSSIPETAGMTWVYGIMPWTKALCLMGCPRFFVAQTPTGFEDKYQLTERQAQT